MSSESQTGLFAVTELEGKLRGPDGPALRNRLVGRFDSLIKDLNAYMSSGPAPADYAGAEVVLKAIAAAREVVVSIPTGT